MQIEIMNTPPKFLKSQFVRIHMAYDYSCNNLQSGWLCQMHVANSVLTIGKQFVDCCAIDAMLPCIVDSARCINITICHLLILIILRTITVIAPATDQPNGAPHCVTSHGQNTSAL